MVAVLTVRVAVAQIEVVVGAVALLPVVAFQADKLKDVLPPEVREVIAVKALPVLQKVVTVQEDNLFLYYISLSLLLNGRRTRLRL